MLAMILAGGAELVQDGWVRIVMRPGAQAALQAYRDMQAGRSDAREGLMLDMRG